MRESMRIIKHLIMNNSINDRDDAELFELASREDIRDELEVMSEEWDFTLVRTFHDIYIVPLPDNEMFNMRFREFRESISSNAKKTDAYLQCYIIMVILWMLPRRSWKAAAGRSRCTSATITVCLVFSPHRRSLHRF